ncbi:MAG: thioredoxin, partial [Ignavibacteriae bacterium HGW-Ignavibacteriae-3]
TWCVPCREEFPDLIKINNEFKGKNVEVVGISIDYPDEITSKIIPFLKKNKANFKNYVKGFPKDEDLINAIDENWNGALPATIIYDRNGKKVSFFEGKRSYEEFKAELEKARK